MLEILLRLLEAMLELAVLAAEDPKGLRAPSAVEHEQEEREEPAGRDEPEELVRRHPSLTIKKRKVAAAGSRVAVSALK